MTRSYDIEILSSARKILTDDTTDDDSYCVRHYVRSSKYIVQAMNPELKEYPQVTLWFLTGESDAGLPSQEGELRIGIWSELQEQLAKTNSSNLGARIIELLDRNPEVLNEQGFGTIIRTIRKQSAILLPPDKNNILHYSIVFRVIFADNWSG